MGDFGKFLGGVRIVSFCPAKRILLCIYIYMCVYIYIYIYIYILCILYILYILYIYIYIMNMCGCMCKIGVPDEGKWNCLKYLKRGWNIKGKGRGTKI